MSLQRRRVWALLQLEKLSGKDVAPDITGEHFETRRHSILTFLQLMDEFNACEDMLSVVEGFEAQHGRGPELDTSVILLD